MEFLPPIATFVLTASVLLLLTLLVVRLRQRHGQRRGGHAVHEALDTVADWPPEAARVLSVGERQAHELLKRALPGCLVLAQVPLARFIRVPLRRSYGEWLSRAGSLSADILLCDSGSRVLAVVDILTGQENERSRRRHERMARVLKAAGIHVSIWREESLPTASAIRRELGGLLGVAAEGITRPPATSRAMPMIPVPEIEEILAAGDRATYDGGMEPVPSGFFEELEAAGAPAPR